jgi:hypothetical protein
MTTAEISKALDRIGLEVGAIWEACDEYGGWAGDDEDAKRAIEIGNRLEGLGFVVGLYGREVAEMGRVDA